MVIPQFDLMTALGAVPCPTCCGTHRVLYTCSSTVSSITEEEVVRDKLYGEYNSARGQV